MTWTTRRHNRQISVYDERGELRSVSADVADAMGWSASNPNRAQVDAPVCDFCGEPMHPAAAPDMWVCDACGVTRLD